MPHAESPKATPAAPAREAGQHVSIPSTEELPPLHVNDGILDTSDIARLCPSYPNEPLSTLRARYAEDGYLFMKGIIPRNAVLSARESYFRFLAPSGVTSPTSAPVDGIFNSTRPKSDFPGIGTAVAGDNRDLPFVKLALQAHEQDWYTEDFCKHPALSEFVSYLTGWGDKVQGFKRTLLRNNVPGQKAIGVHYDQIFLRHGEPNSVTAWVPMGDVRVEGGGLIYLEKGHRLGEEQEAKFFEEANRKGMSEEERKFAFNSNMAASGLLDEGSGPKEYGKRFERRWLVTDYEAGDVVLHSPFSIHASTVNHDPEGRIRLGTDIRFVDKTSNWDTRWGRDFYKFDDGL